MQRTIVLFVILLLHTAVPAQHVFTIDDVISERNFMANELPIYVDQTNSHSFWQVTSNVFSNRFVVDSAYQNKDFQPNTSYQSGLSLL